MGLHIGPQRGHPRAVQKRRARIMTDLGMIVPCPICADAMTIPILSHTEEAVVLALPALERALAVDWRLLHRRCPTIPPHGRGAVACPSRRAPCKRVGSPPRIR